MQYTLLILKNYLKRYPNRIFISYFSVKSFFLCFQLLHKFVIIITTGHKGKKKQPISRIVNVILFLYNVYIGVAVHIYIPRLCNGSEVLHLIVMVD